MSVHDDFESELRDLREKGLARVLPADGGDLVNLSSNDYLGLSRHPDVVSAALDATRQWGTGGTSARLLAGTGPSHRSLETALAAALEKDAALVFSSGYHANTGILPALANASDFIAFDRLSHASIIDGVKLSGAAFAPFKHNDAADLERVLSLKRGGRRRAFVVTEGIFSMDGDRPPLADLVAAARRHDALLYLDEAHSFGLVGPGGRGLAAERGLLNEIDLHVGTLSKTLASQGGFIAARRTIIDLLTTRSRSFLFTTALAPACAAAAEAALMLLPSMDARRAQVDGDARRVRDGVREAGFDTLASDSAIVPVWTGDVAETARLSKHLLTRGFFVPSIRPPTVSPGDGRVRLSLTYRDDRRWPDALVAAFAAFDGRPHREGERIVQAG
jgi:8-amino-7-oxononanoate synthase